MAKKSNNLTGVTGKYFVCAELGKQGILALLTPKNNPLFDVVAVSADASRTVTIQVKTMSQGNNQGWKLGVDICTTKNNPLLYTILVNLTGSQIDYYIYEYDVLSEKIKNIYSQFLFISKVTLLFISIKYIYIYRERESYERSLSKILLSKQ